MSILTRYGGSYLLDDLLLGRMSVSGAESFNDPFEFHFKPGKPLSNAQAKRRVEWLKDSRNFKAHVEAIKQNHGLSREAVRKMTKEKKKELIEEIKVSDLKVMNAMRNQILSFTDDVAKILCCTEGDLNTDAENAMWAYYGDNHRGARVHLSEEDFKPFHNIKIDYNDVPPAYESMELLNGLAMQKFMMTALGRKSLAWKHEQEIRLLVSIEDIFKDKDIHGNQRHFTELKPQSLKRIDLGIRFKNPQEAFIEIKSKLPGVEVFKAEKCPNSYSVQYAPMN